MFIKSFEGDLDKITKIQNSFIEKSKEFVYLRKGEFENIVEIFTFVSDFLARHPEIILMTVAAYPGAKEIVTDVFKNLKKMKNKKGQFVVDEKKKGELTFRVIASEEAEERKPKELDKFEEMGAGVCIIPREESGRIRFFVNEKKFCLFIRSDNDKDKFFGIIGKNKLMIHRLRELFDQEYVKYMVLSDEIHNGL